MPCCEDGPEVSHKNDVWRYEKHVNNIKNLKNCLHSLLSEIEKDKFYEILRNASKNGKIDILNKLKEINNYKFVYSISETDIKLIEKQIDNIEAILCAVISEIEKFENFDIIFEKADERWLKNNKLSFPGESLTRFWREHSKKDEIRLMLAFNYYSEHEKEIIKKMLFSKKILQK